MCKVFDPTVILSPAAKTLIQVEGSLAVSQLHIRKPFRYDIQKCRIHPNGSPYFHQYFSPQLQLSCLTYKCNHYPTLRRIVGFPKFVSPTSAPASLEETRCLFPPYFAPCLLFSSILYPIYHLSVLQVAGSRAGHLPIVVKSYIGLAPIQAYKFIATEARTSYLLILSISSSI